MVCKRCGSPLTGQQTAYCSPRCSKLAGQARYRKRAHERIKAYKRNWKKTHRELLNGQARRYREKHKDQINAKQRARFPKRKSVRRYRKRTIGEKIRPVYTIACLLCPNGEHLTERRNRIHCAKHTRGFTNADRFRILKRDNFTCRYCGRKAPEVPLHVDHAVSLKRGGPNDDHNLVTSCSQCNNGKGAFL